MVSTTLQGRLGNQFYQIATLLAYAKKHNLEYYIPDVAYHCDGRKMYFPYLAMGPELTGMKEYHEQSVHAVPKGDGTFLYNVPAYQELPRMDNTKFVGYWQSFRYFDDYRGYILEKFNLFYIKRDGCIGIHVRRGDFVQLQDKHPVIPMDYYMTAIQMFVDKGYMQFIILSDDIAWCKTAFIDAIKLRYNEPVNWGLVFPENKTDQTEIDDLVLLSECEHQILCYSTFGFVAAWLNRNPNKQVIIPPSRFTFGGCNADFIPSYYKELEFQ